MFMQEAMILITLRHPALLRGVGVLLPQKPEEPAIVWV
jgi:hypothetical protein